MRELVVVHFNFLARVCRRSRCPRWRGLPTADDHRSAFSLPRKFRERQRVLLLRFGDETEQLESVDRQDGNDRSSEGQNAAESTPPAFPVGLFGVNDVVRGGSAAFDSIVFDVVFGEREL